MINNSDPKQSPTSNAKNVIRQSKNECIDSNGDKLVSTKTIFDDGSFIIEEQRLEGDVLIPSRRVEYTAPLRNETETLDAELELKPQITKDTSPAFKTLHEEKNAKALDDRIAAKMAKNAKQEVVSSSTSATALDARIASKMAKNSTNAKPEVVTSSITGTGLNARIASKMAKNSTNAKPEVVTSSITGTGLNASIASKMAKNSTNAKPEVNTNSTPATVLDARIASKMARNSTVVTAIDNHTTSDVSLKSSTINPDMVSTTITATEGMCHNSDQIDIEEIQQEDPEQPSSTNENRFNETVEAYVVTEIEATAVEIEREETYVQIEKEEKKNLCCSESIFKTKRGTIKKRCWAILATLIVCCVIFGIVFSILSKPRAAQPSSPTTITSSHTSNSPSNNPSNVPSISSYPSHSPTSRPSKHPSSHPSKVPTYLIPEFLQKGQGIVGEAENDYSGVSVSISSDGMTVAISAYTHDGINGTKSGHVQVYEYSDGSWVQKGQDIDGEAAYDYSGESVSLSSDGMTVAIGAPYNEGNGSCSGHVRVYEYSNGAWVQKGQDIDGESAEDWSGSSVSLSSDGMTIAIGAPLNDGINGSDSGHVRVYKYSDGAWVQVGQDIDGESADDYSGGSVSLSSDGMTVAIGAPFNRGFMRANSGHVRVYEYSDGSWVQKGHDINGESADDWSGWSVSLSSDGMTVAIGAEYNDGNGLNSGHVRVYEYSDGSWEQKGQDIDGEVAGDNSGSSSSVSLSSDGMTVAIGAPFNDGNGLDSGHVRVYRYSVGAWLQVGQDIDGEATNDNSGWSVSLSSDGTTVAIGAPKHRANGINSGHVRVYQLEFVAYSN